MTGEFKTHFRAIEEVQQVRNIIFFSGAAKIAKYDDLTFPTHPFSIYILIQRLRRIEGMHRRVKGGRAEQGKVRNLKFLLARSNKRAKNNDLTSPHTLLSSLICLLRRLSQAEVREAQWVAWSCPGES